MPIGGPIGRFTPMLHRPKYYLCGATVYACGATVKNLRIFATLLNGEQLELRDCPTGSDLIGAILHEAAAGAKALVIEATDKEGRVVRIVVPGDDSETARVAIAVDA